MKLDLTLLKSLLVLDHPSKHEWPMLSFILNQCYKIDNLHFELDGYCNLFITKNTSNPEFYPCIVAHTDCVIPCEHKSFKIKNDRITGRNNLNGKSVALGADDANGICCALQLLKVIPDLKVCFTTEEEVGFLGADYATQNIDFFYDVSYMIQADRHGGSDLITYTNGIYSASNEWLQEAAPIMANFGYSEHYGIGTDVGVLAEQLQLSGVNISCGYYNEHTANELVVISELQNCLNFMESLLKNIPLDKQYKIVIDYKAYNRYYSRYDWEADSATLKNHFKSSKMYDHPVEDELPCEKCKTYDCMHCEIYPE